MRLLLLVTAILCLSQLSCSRILRYWVEAQFELSECPAADFEFPERVKAGNGLIVGTDAPTYCHGFQFFEIYAVNREQEFHGIAASSADFRMYAKLLRGQRCRLQIAISRHCSINQSKEACRKQRGPGITSEELRSQVRRAAEPMFFGEDLEVQERVELKRIGYLEDFKTWCEAQGKKEAS